MGGDGVEFHAGMFSEEVIHSPFIREENDMLSADIDGDFHAGSQVKLGEGFAGHAGREPPDLIEGSGLKAWLGAVLGLEPVSDHLEL